MLLAIQKSCELLANYGCFAREMCDKCGIVLGAVCFTRYGESEVYCSRECRGDAHRSATLRPGRPRKYKTDRERQISEITARLLDAHPDSLRTKLRDIRGFVTARMRNLRTIMNSDIAHVRAELAKHIEKITLTPGGECYIASGTWNFVGRGSIDGAGGGKWTEPMPVRFEWLAAA